MKISFLQAALLFAIMPLAVRAADPAPAFCPPVQPLYPPSVGDTAHDSNCDYDTIQAAIDAQTCPATIAITREHLYTNQHLSIQNKSITLEGLGDGVGCPGPVASGAAIPAAEPTGPVVTLDGSGSGGRVLSIGGTSNVTLKYIEIKGGSLNDNPTGDGGGIGYEGSGSLTLDTCTVDDNAADYGGGINFKGTGDPDNDPPAVLTIGQNTLVLDNTADISGGGIRIEGDARLFVLKPGTTIYGNHAPGGYGGGLEVLGPAIADIGSPGYAGVPVIDYNDAEYGGGIAVIGTTDGGSFDASVRLFTTDPDSPVQVSNNSATRSGGGVFVQPNDSFTGDGNNDGAAAFCASNFRMDGNVAAEGAAIYGDSDYSELALSSFGAHISLGRLIDWGYCGAPEEESSLGAVACAADTSCNTIDGNGSRDGGGQPTDGATILVQDGGELGVYGLRMQANEGAHGLRVLDHVLVDIQDCLLTGNAFSSAAMLFEGGNAQPDLVDSVRGCTFANNVIGSGSVVDSSHDLKLWEDILGDDVPVAVMENNAALYPGSLLVADAAGLPAEDSIVQGTADFVDAASGDYHLLPDSLGVDVAPSGGGVDLDGRRRDVDLASVPNAFGPRDLGAYERQSAFACDDHADAVFCAGFELP
ncbi:MAG TPA: hypothetical protein VFG73_04900 [Rhodanobacteraceae bacterium]|nr:hypothetical protein [Rhodanobacteraceae bacterium]